jgi:hypothetical protein
MTQRRFKHSGTWGDVIYSLSLMRYLGGGEFYLHLNQVDWITKYYYGNSSDPYHQGRMTANDLEWARDFLEQQQYITKVAALDPQTTEITDNLDNFRPLFVGHPANYITVNFWSRNIRDPEIIDRVSREPWLTVNNAKPWDSRPWVVNRSARGFTGPRPHPHWYELREQGLESRAIFVGLKSEYEEFCRELKISIPHAESSTMGQLAQWIGAAELFLGNQSLALSLAQGLGVKYQFEPRIDLPLERNESYIAQHGRSTVFPGVRE